MSDATALHPTTRLARRWRLAGRVLLAMSLVAAGWWLLAPDPPTGALHYSVVGGQTFAEADAPSGWQAQQIKRVGGQGTLLIGQLDDWLGSLWQGRRLAATLAVLTLAAALACHWIAGLVAAGRDLE